MPVDDSNFDEDWERERAEEEEDRRRKAEPRPQIDEAEFLTWRSPRDVAVNPTRLENLLWNWMVRTRWDAYSANDLFAGPSAFDAGPMWTFQRFGKSETNLEDGRVVHIGGEHEDHYDPDFYIYNDVTVIDAAGGISIFGYPRTSFPPTDFHSATRVGDAIYIIGRLGYPESRLQDVTPVYKLCLASMRIDAVHTGGKSPGWIYRHAASLLSDGDTIVVSGGERWLGPDRATRKNVDSWSFNVHSAEWNRLTEHHWQHWVMRRVDRKANRLWDIRQELWRREHTHLGLEPYWHHSDEPDFAALRMLYRVAATSALPAEGPEAGVFTIVIDGLTVRFQEERHWVEAIVEGQLSRSRLTDLQGSTLALLERLDGARYEIEGPDDGTDNV